MGEVLPDWVTTWAIMGPFPDGIKATLMSQARERAPKKVRNEIAFICFSSGNTLTV